MALRTCCSASSNFCLFEAAHPFSYSLLALDGTFKLVTLTEVARTSDKFQGKHFSSSAIVGFGIGGTSGRGCMVGSADGYLLSDGESPPVEALPPVDPCDPPPPAPPPEPPLCA